MISYRVGSVTTEVSMKQFRDSCMNPNISIGSSSVDFKHHRIDVSVRFGPGTGYSMNDILVALGCTMDALRVQYPCSTFGLFMPYLPYARQDRACSPGEAFGARFAANMINGMGFAYITCLDPHSSVLNGLYKNLYVMDQFQIFGKIYPSFHDVYIVAPDAGASKKCEEFAKMVDAAGVLVCDKSRNMKTIEIEGHKLLTPVPNGAKKFLILDDIGDGMRTFVSVHNLVTKSVDREISIDLAITHGLFTFGEEIVTDLYDNVYTTNSWVRAEHPKVKYVKV